MPSFSYQAINAKSEVVKGTLSASDRAAAIQQLAQSSMVVLQLTEGADPASPRVARATLLTRRRQRLGRRRTALLLLEWGRLLAAGLTVDEVLSLSLDRGVSDRSALVARELRDAVRAGAHFHAALQKHLPDLPDSGVAIVRAAEMAGSIAEGVSRVGEDMLSAEQFTAELRTALIYPAFVLVTALIVLAILLSVVIPSLESLIQEFRQQPSGTASVVIGLSQLVRSHWAALVCLALLVIVAPALARMSESGRTTLDRVILRLPGVSSLVISLDCRQFAHSLAVMLDGGLHLSSAIPLAAHGMRNRALRDRVLVAAKGVGEGAGFGAALAKISEFPRDIVNLIKTGERSGRLSIMLAQSARLHEERVRRTLKFVVASMTPALTIFLGVITGLIVLTVVTTIMDLNEVALR